MAKLLNRAKKEINLKKLGIDQLPKIRRAANGGTLIEINKRKNKANLLGINLRQVLPQGTKISVPTINATIRVFDFDDSISRKKIQEALIAKMGCLKDKLTCGNIITMRSGMHSM